MKKILVVVDYQKDFVNGSLGFEKAVSLEAGICKKIKQYMQNGDEVVFTFDTHKENYLQTQEGKNLPIPHCLRNSEGWNLYGKVADLCDERSKRLEKVTFGSLELAAYLTSKEFASVELVGVVSNICVISNAVIAKAAVPEAEIIVDASCTGSFDEGLNQKALDVMQSLQINVINRDN